VTGLETPKLTAAQLLAVVKDAIAVAVAFGLHLTTEQQTALLILAGSTTALLLAADAAIRRARAKHVAGPVLDKAAADAIAAAAAARDTFAGEPIKPATQIVTQTSTLEHEAELEDRARAANAELGAGVDPATLD
jgi:hypothetical protein